MQDSPVQAVDRLMETFRRGPEQALLALRDCGRSFEETARRVEQMLGQRTEAGDPEGEGPAREEGIRVGRRGYTWLWLAIAAGSLCAFAAGFWAGTTR